MPSVANACPTMFEDGLFTGTVSVSAHCPRLGGGDGEFERPSVSLELVIICKAMLKFDDRSSEIRIEIGNLPPSIKAVVHFLEKLDLSSFVPETAQFENMNTSRDLAVFTARANGVPTDVINETLAEIPPPNTEIPGLPYRTPMRPDLFFDKCRQMFIADAIEQLRGIID